MGKKYIIELEDNESVYKTVYKTIIADEHPILQVIAPAPYTEPDIEHVREDAFKNGYDAACKDIDIKSKTNAAHRKGLEDAWEAARKIALTEGLGIDGMYAVFGTEDPEPIFREYSVNECIEKIRQYEQKKEEIQVGDEVIYDGKRCVVVFPQTEHLRATIIDCGRFHHAHIVEYDELKKTGRHFPELVEVLKKMKETE